MDVREVICKNVNGINSG